MNAPSPTETTALTVAARQQFDLSPQTFDQALTFSEYLAGSEMVPKNFRGKPGDCLIAMQWGYEVGLKPLQALQNISVINGKPGLYGDAGKAILLANGCIIEEDDIALVEKHQRGRCKITRPGRPPVERTFSVENAKTAGLWGKEGPWRTHPWRQMAWRAFWFAARDAAADLLKGLMGAEEAIDLPVVNMGMAEPLPPAHYPDDAFQENLPKWLAAIEAGKKTADQIIATVETKAPLTDAQKAQIRQTKAAAQDVVPKVTYAQVADKLTAAQDTDALAEAASLISAISDDTQRAELTALYERRGKELPF